MPKEHGSARDASEGTARRQKEEVRRKNSPCLFGRIRYRNCETEDFRRVRELTRAVRIACVASGFSRKINGGGSLPPEGGSYTTALFRLPDIRQFKCPLGLGPRTQPVYRHNVSFRMTSEPSDPGRNGAAGSSLLPEGTHVDAYRIDRLLGEGGMSGDGRWLYYSALEKGIYHIRKVRTEDRQVVDVRQDDAVGCAVAPDGSVLYYAKVLVQSTGLWDIELRAAAPETGPSVPLGRIPASRIPVDPANIQPYVSPDGRWLAMPLLDGPTANLWALSTETASGGS